MKAKPGPQPEPPKIPEAVSRQARLMAFAIVFEEWLAEGKVSDYAELTEITGFDPVTHHPDHEPAAAGAG